jgi:hypothetical protein
MEYAVVLSSRYGHGLGWDATLEVLSVHATRDEAVAAARVDAAVARLLHHARGDDRTAAQGVHDYPDGDRHGRVATVGGYTTLRVETVAAVRGYADALEAAFGRAVAAEERALLDAALARAS